MTFMQGISFFTCPCSLPASPAHLPDCWGISLRQLYEGQDLVCNTITRKDITNSCEERNRLSLEIEALDIVINRCTELVNFPDTDGNHEMKAILRASVDDTQRKKDTMVSELRSLPPSPTNVNNAKNKKKKKKRKINKKDSVEDFVFRKKTARPVSPLPSEPVTVNKSFSDLESENDKDQVAPEENNETVPPKPKAPPTIHLKIKKNIRDQLKSIYQKFPNITNKLKNRWNAGILTIINQSVSNSECGPVCDLKTVAEVSKNGRCYPTTSIGSTKSHNPRQDQYLVISARRQRSSTSRALGSVLTVTTGIRISRQTAYRRLNHAGLYARRLEDCIPLTPADKHARLN
ncbi:uncharacterized protein TNCV_758421 [Trichonephila clavipes]|nr:uncharacterized protein TNCV_758421 [Trichonephila clavipes]